MNPEICLAYCCTDPGRCAERWPTPCYPLQTALGFRITDVTDARQQAALEEAIDNLQEALHHIKTTLLVLRLAEMDSQPDTEDLVNRVFAALAMTEAAHVDARRRRTERVEATGE